MAHTPCRVAKSSVPSAAKVRRMRLQPALELSCGSPEKAERIMAMPLFAVACDGQEGMLAEVRFVQLQTREAA